MEDLGSYINSLESSEVLEIKEPISRAYEVTKLLKENERERVVKFRLDGSRFWSVGNIFKNRSDIWRAIGAKNEQEAYDRLLNSIERPGKASEEKFGLAGTDMGLDELPFSKFYPTDGGMYLTSGVIFAKLGDISNASYHRMLLMDKRHAAMRVVPRHLFTMLKEQRKKREELEVALVVGMNPAEMFAAAMSPRYGIFEMDVAAALSENASVSYTPKYSIPVPSSASIVVEGRIKNETAKEGPFFDLTLTNDIVRDEPVFEAEAFYARRDALLNTILPGGEEHKLLMGYPREAAIYQSVSKVVPKVKKVRLTSGGGMWLHCAISIEKNTDGDAKNAILAAFTGHTSLKNVVVVDSDVDIDDLSQIEWAIATRFQTNKLMLFSEMRGSSLDPSGKDGLTSKMGIDATAPINEASKYKSATLPKLRPIGDGLKEVLEELKGNGTIRGYLQYFADEKVVVFAEHGAKIEVNSIPKEKLEVIEY